MDEQLLSCKCNQPGEATHTFGDQRFCWSSGAMPIPEWIKKAAEIVPNDVSDAHPTFPSSEGILSDQRRNQTPLQPSEFRGGGTQSRECWQQIHPDCSLVGCGCKCHVY